MSAMGKERENLHLQTNDLESRVPKTLPGGSNHSQQLKQIQSSLLDLAHRVTHLPAAVSPPPLLSHPAPTPTPIQSFKERSPEEPLHTGMLTRQCHLQQFSGVQVTFTKQPLRFSPPGTTRIRREKRTSSRHWQPKLCPPKWMILPTEPLDLTCVLLE